jgi:HK97 family phage portal protein
MRPRVFPGVFSFIEKQAKNKFKRRSNMAFDLVGKAVRTSAVYACVKILAETIVGLPLQLFKEKDDGCEKARYHPLYRCLYQSPNPETTSFCFRENMTTALLLWGNAYAEKVADRDGHVKELWYLPPDRMNVTRDRNRELTYEYLSENGGITRYRASEIFHVKGLSFDGVKGLSPIGQMREAIGLSLATEAYGAAFFGNSARPSGIIEHPGAVKDPERMRESWNKVFQGAVNSGKTAVLEQGSKYHAIGIPPEEAQFLETRKFQINEICRIFRVPPHLVGDLDKATFSKLNDKKVPTFLPTYDPYNKDKTSRNCAGQQA